MIGGALSKKDTFMIVKIIIVLAKNWINILTNWQSDFITRLSRFGNGYIE